MSIHDRDPRNHPWWNHVPIERRLPTLIRRKRLLLKSALFSQASKLIATLVASVGVSLVIAGSGAGAMGIATLVPLLVLPALAGVAWWLTWKEFHH
jgi:glucose-6-phosphate dehydrogenase assembly protein OpcA